MRIREPFIPKAKGEGKPYSESVRMNPLGKKDQKIRMDAPVLSSVGQFCYSVHFSP